LQSLELGTGNREPRVRAEFRWAGEGTRPYAPRAKS